MSTKPVPTKDTSSDAKAGTVDMKFEIVVLPVSDVDRAKEFYAKLGWRLDADYAHENDFRVIQFTPPGSGCSVIFGKNVTAAAPGSSQGLYLIVPDIEAVRAELLRRGVEVSEVFHNEGVYAGTDEPYLSGRVRLSGPDAEHRSYRSFASFKDPDGNGWLFQQVTARYPAAWTRTRPSPRRRSLQPRSGVRRPRMASTRSGPVGTMRTGRTGTLSTSSRSRPASRCRHDQRLRTGKQNRPCTIAKWREINVRRNQP